MHSFLTQTLTIPPNPIQSTDPRGLKCKAKAGYQSISVHKYNRNNYTIQIQSKHKTNTQPKEVQMCLENVTALEMVVFFWPIKNTLTSELISALLTPRRWSMFAIKIWVPSFTSFSSNKATTWIAKILNSDLYKRTNVLQFTSYSCPGYIYHLDPGRLYLQLWPASGNTSCKNILSGMARIFKPFLPCKSP